MGNWAFFSYARADGAVAEKLHGALDRYRTPGDLVGTAGAHGPVPATFHPVFRDVSDLSGGGHLNEKIERALADSTCLVVLCSPAASASPWVDRECQTFIDQGKAARIFPVIAPDLPAAGERDERFEETFFPPALRGKGFLAADLRETQAASGKPVGDGEDNGRMKLIAGLLGVALDALVKREQRRQRRLVAMLSVAALVFAGVAAAAGGLWWLSNRRAVVIASQKVEIAKERDTALANERRALKGEADALTAQGIAEKKEGERQIQQQLAEGNARRARNTLHQLFATQAWDKHEDQDYQAAARYALAGMRKSPVNAARYSTALASIMHKAAESLPPLLHDWGVSSATFSPNGSVIVTASYDKTAKIWSADDGRLIASLVGHSDAVRDVSFSADGSLLVTASDDDTARIWRTQDWSFVGALKGHRYDVRRASFSKDGRRVVTTSWDKTVKVWSVADRSVIRTIRPSRDSYNSSATFSPDGELIAIVGAGGMAEIHNVSDDGYRTEYLAGHDDQIWAANFSPNGSRIITASEDGTAIVWKKDDKWRPIRTLRGHRGAVRNASYSRDGERIVTAGEDGTVKIWDATYWGLLATLGISDGSVVDAEFSPNRDRIVATGGRSAKIVTVPNGRLVEVERRTERYSTDKSPDRSRSVESRFDGTALVRSAQDGRLIGTVRHGKEYLDVVFSRDGARFATIASEMFPVTSDVRVVKIWSADGQPVATLNAHSEPIKSAAFSKDGRRIVTASRDGTAIVWGTVDWHPIITLRGHSSFVSDAAFSDDGNFIATASYDGTAKIWSTRNWGVLATLSGHSHVLNGVSFSQDSQRVVTAADNGGVKVWNRQDGRLMATLSEDGDDIRSAEFSADDERVVAETSGGTQRIWDTRRLTQRWQDLARDACLNLLGPYDRTFRRTEIDADQLLLAEWNSPSRDVCEGVPGVPSIAEMRLRAGLAAVQPAP